ncbi:MAG TPA: hypothetical protein VM680_18660 [Verrucomicrobiae bacterium]|nr:hypothetical protein [Verrucomicrobiae bacterium]
MKRFGWIGLAIAVALPMICKAADVAPVGTGTITALPAHGDSVTINGSVRTFVTNLTSASTQVLIGATTNATASNWWTQLQSYPYTDVSSATYGARVFLAGRVNASMTGSKIGTWGTIGITNEPLNEYAVTLPWETIPPAYRMEMANYLIDAISTYPTNQIPALAAAMANFMNLSEAQPVTGRKSFATLDAALAYIGTGSEDGRFGLNVWDNLSISNAIPNFRISDTAGGVDEKHFVISYGAGLVNFTLLDDALSTASTIMAFNRDGIQFTVPIQAAVTMRDSTFTNVISTNSILHATTLFANLINLTNGNFYITNNGAVIRLVDNGGSADDKRTDIVADGDSFQIRFYDDAGNLISTPIQIDRAGGVSTLAVNGALNAANEIIAEGYIEGHGNAYFTGMLAVGGGTTFPTGATGGFYAFDSTGPSADPATGFYIWSEGGVFKYRGSTASEGSGGSFAFHNRTESTAGSGSDYPLTTSTAAVDFGGTDPNITLPTPGTYWVTAHVSLVGGGTANDDYRFKMRNTTTAADVSDSDYWVSNVQASQRQPLTFGAKVTTATINNVIALYGFNNTAARGTVEAPRTKLAFTRMY